STTTGVSHNSFTQAVIRELRRLSGRHFSVALLHELLVKHQAEHALRMTPLHIFLSERVDVSSVLLIPLANAALLPDVGSPLSFLITSNASESTSTVSPLDEAASENSAASAISPVKLVTDCRVLISI